MFLTLEDLEALASPAMIDRGRRYWIEGYVQFMQSAAGQLKGIVTGSLGDYRVVVEWKDGVIRAQCDCPFKGAFCKHATALVWGWLNHSERFLSHEHVVSLVERLTPTEMRVVLREISVNAPEVLAMALKQWQPAKGLGEGIVRDLADSLGKGRLQRPEWLMAWRRALQLLESGSGDLDTLNRLITLGFRYLRESETMDPDFIALFGQTIQAWSQRAKPGILPEWWNDGWDALTMIQGKTRRQLRHAILNSLEPWSGSILTTLGYPPELDDEGFGAGIDYVIGRLLICGGDLRPVKEWALYRLERALKLMDLYTEEEAWNLLKDLARDGLRRAETGDRLIFRRRLALSHRKLGEPKQALALLGADFLERPGWEEYLELSETAKEAGEPARAFQVAQRSLRMTRVELLAKIMIHEDKIEELLELAPDLPPQAPEVQTAAQSMRRYAPTAAKTLWERRAFAWLEEGTRRGVKEAMPSLVEIKKLCREMGWSESWEAFARDAKAKILDPVALEMTASILSPLTL